MTYHSTFRRGGSGALAAEILRDSPRAYWKLAETSGTTMADSSGNGYNLTASSVTLANANLLGDSTVYPYLSSTSSRFSRSGTLGLATPVNGDLSYECVVMLPSRAGGNGRRLFSFAASGETEPTNFQFQPSLTANVASVSEFWEYGAGVNVSVNGRHRVLPCVPTHLAFVRDVTAGEYRFYVNGEFDSVGTWSALPSGGGSCSTYIGWNTSASDPMWIGHCAVWDSVLSAERIKAHFRATGLMSS